MKQLRVFTRVVVLSLLMLSITIHVFAQDDNSDDETMELLFVQAADSGSVRSNDDGTFTLSLHNAHHLIWFSDRPVRRFGHITNDEFIIGWSSGNDNFAEDPPNAALAIDEAVYIVELLNATFDDDTRTFVYTVQSLQSASDVTEANELKEMEFETATLFIDDWSDISWPSMPEMDESCPISAIVIVSCTLVTDPS